MLHCLVPWSSYMCDVQDQGLHQMKRQRIMAMMMMMMIGMMILEHLRRQQRQQQRSQALRQQSIFPCPLCRRFLILLQSTWRRLSLVRCWVRLTRSFFRRCESVTKQPSYNQDVEHMVSAYHLSVGRSGLVAHTVLQQTD